MADRKSSDNPTLVTLADGDLFDILDVSETTESEKNKSITKGDLFAQIGSELALTGSPVLTQYTTGFESGYSGTLTFYKLSRIVSFQFDITVSSPLLALAVNVSVIDGTLVPLNHYYAHLISSNNTQAGKLLYNNIGQVQISRNGTAQTVLPNGAYQVSGMFFSVV